MGANESQFELTAILNANTCSATADNGDSHSSVNKMIFAPRFASAAKTSFVKGERRRASNSNQLQQAALRAL